MSEGNNETNISRYISHINNFSDNCLTFNENDYLSGYKPDFLIHEKILKTVGLQHNIENNIHFAEKVLWSILMRNF